MSTINFNNCFTLTLTYPLNFYLMKTMLIIIIVLSLKKEISDFGSRH